MQATGSYRLTVQQFYVPTAAKIQVRNNEGIQQSRECKDLNAG